MYLNYTNFYWFNSANASKHMKVVERHKCSWHIFSGLSFEMLGLLFTTFVSREWQHQQIWSGLKLWLGLGFHTNPSWSWGQAQGQNSKCMSVCMHVWCAKNFCLNLSMSDMPSCKVELSFTVVILLYKVTVFIIYLLSSSRYHMPWQGNQAYIIIYTYCFCIISTVGATIARGNTPASAIFFTFALKPIWGKNSIPNWSTSRGPGWSIM